MNELFGMLIPLLMSGAGLGDILRTLGGAGQGAAGMDGLSSVMSLSLMRAKQYFPLKQNQETINSAAEMLADRLGINPYSGLGQGIVNMLGSAYHLAPDMIGGILGIPNGQNFFSAIANGASGISLAAGYGQTDVLNPYSVMENHKRAMEMAKTVYDLGVKQGGGYDIAYSHGLNMEEMGKVTQRLLSSRMAYREVAEGEDGTLMENGKDISFDKESEKFKENIKKLGSKFNEAASMLSKVTGSVEEALNMMDRLAGGNFLGGTAEQASRVASQAKRMATAIRVTSAIAGISPTEAYANMTNLQNGMATGMGMSSYIAKASGFSSLMGDMAFNATMGYNTWLAMNPNASPMQRQQALLAVNGRAQAYASSNAAALAAAIADNADSFSSEELKQIQDDMRSGHPEAIVDLVRSRIGESRYNTYMTDPSVQAAARYNVSKNEMKSALMKDLDQANLEGGLQQVEDYGARLMTRRTLSDIDDDLARRSGKTDFAAGRTAAVKETLVEIAVKQGKMTQKGAEAMDVNDLRAWLQKRPGIDKSDLARAENLAEIQESRRQIDSLTMNEEQEEAARARLIKEIDNTTFNEDKKRELKILAGKKGSNLDAIANDAFSAKTADERRELMKSVFQGRFSKAGAAEEKKRLEELEKSQDQNYTVDERMAAITRDSARQDLTEMGGLKKMLAIESQGDMRKALENFSERARGLEKSGSISLEEDKDLSKTYNEAARRMVSGIFGDKLGDMEGADLKKFETRISEEIVKGMQGGNTFQKAFASAMGKLTKEEKEKIGFGKDGNGKTLAGEETVNDFIEKAKKGELDNADWKAFQATSSSVIDERSKGVKADAIKEMTKLAKGDIGKLSEADAFKRFTELAKTVGGYDISDEEFDKLSAEKAKSIGEKGSAQKAMSDMLGAMKPRGQRDLGFFAMSGTGSPDKAGILMAATMFKMAGGDMSKLNLGKEWESILSTIDDEKAGRTMNAVSNAIHVGGASYQKEAIKSAETQALRLGELVNNDPTLLEDAKAAYGTGPDAEKAKERLLGKLKGAGSSDAKSDAAMIATLQGQTIGGQNAMEVMQKGKKGLEAAKKEAGDKYDEQMVGVVRESARKDSAAYDIGKAIGDFTRMISPFIKDPASVFKSPIPVQMWGPVDLSGKGMWP